MAEQKTPIQKLINGKLPAKKPVPSNPAKPRDRGIPGTNGARG
jgi:hypothetical protein